jgi:hypothetical protein
MGAHLCKADKVLQRQCVVFRRFDIDYGFKTAVTFPTAPKMTILMLTPILGPFGSDQIIVALNALHSEA